MWLGERRGTLTHRVSEDSLSSTSPSDSRESATKRPYGETVPLRGADGSPIVGRRTLDCIVAIAEALFSRGGRAPAPDRLSWIAREMEDFLARAGDRSRFIFTFMVWLTSVLAPLFVGRFTILPKLDLDMRIRALRRLEERFGEPLLAVKAILCLVYYEHPDAARDVGFDGECHVPRNRPEGAS